MKKMAEIIVKFRYVIFFAVIAITAFFGYQLKNAKINSDIVTSMPDDDPVASTYKHIGKKFNGNYMGMIIMETDDVFTTQSLEHIKTITDSLMVSEGVSTVTSLTNIIDIKSDEFGIVIGKLVDEYDLPDTPEELDSLRLRVMSKDLYKGNIVSENGKATLIIFTLESEGDKQKMAKAIKEKISGLNLPEKLYFGGMPMLINDIEVMISTDIVRLIPIILLLMILILYLSFRTARGVILPLVSAGISVIWTVGIIVLSGYELTLITNNMPIILLAIGTAYTIHVVNRVDQEMKNGIKDAVVKGLVYIIIPVILAGLTTMIGFISFIFGSYLQMIRDFGIFTAIGTALALTTAIIFIPATLSIFSSNKKREMKVRENAFLKNRILMPVVNLLFKHPKYTFTAWIMVIVVAIGGIFMINISSNMQLYFKKNNASRVTEDILQQDFGGSMPIYVLFKGDIQNPELLKLMKKTQHKMEENKYVTTTQSVADLIEEMNDAMGEGKQVPNERDKIEQLWFLIEGQDIMSQLVTEELDEAIIQSKFSSSESKDMKAFIKEMETFIAQNKIEGCSVEFTGMPSIYVSMNRSLINSQFSSLAIAVLLTLLVVGSILRSFWKGVYATIPILGTIIILFGFMGYMGINLDIATVLVASVALGIGVDYSIHVISHFDRVYKQTGELNHAIENTILVCGKAVFINVMSVTGGFLVLLFSQMVPLQNFGLLVAISMICSGTGSLTMLPAILILAHRKNHKTQNHSINS